MKIIYNGKIHDVVQKLETLAGQKEYVIRLDHNTFLLVEESDCTPLTQKINEER